MQCIVLALLLGFTAAFAQTTTTPPTSFDAASIKPSPPNDPFHLRYDPGRLMAHDQDLRSLIEIAYHLKPYQVQGPQWMSRERFDIDAETQRPLNRLQMNVLLKRFLVRQFGLVTHFASKKFNVYVLEVSAKGPMLKLAAKGAPRFINVSMRLQRANLIGNGTMDDLAGMLTREVDRPVVDDTRLTGRYSFTVTFMPGPENPTVGRLLSMQRARTSARGLPAGAGAPSIFTALREQLGLKLLPRKAPVMVLVIDRINKAPLGNY